MSFAQENILGLYFWNIKKVILFSSSYELVFYEWN